MSSNLLPPGVSLGLYDALSHSTLYFDNQGQGGNWNNAGNWWNGLPTAASNVLVPVSATLNGSFTAKSVMLLGTETVTFNGTLTTNSTNLCESFMVCDTAVAIFDPGSVLNDAGSLIVGNLDHGTLTALGNGSSHATLNSVDAKIGRLSGGVGTVTIDGAHWTNTAHMVVGKDGQGALTVTGNGVVTVGTDLTIGADQGSNGQVTVANGGTLAVYSTLSVGSASSNPEGERAATLTVGANGLVTVGSVLDVYGSETLVMAGGTVRFGAYANGLAIAAGGLLSGFGTIAVPSSGDIVNDGTIVATDGTLLLGGSVQGMDGVLDIASGATLDIQGSAIGHDTIDFAGAGGVLQLAQGIRDGGVIAGFAAGDAIETAGVNGLSFNTGNDVLTLSQGGVAVRHLQFIGTYASNPFTLTQTAAGALITGASSISSSPLAPVPVHAVSAQHPTSPSALPPGVSLGLYDALPHSTLYFDNRGQGGNWNNAGDWWNGLPTAVSNVLVPVSATLNGSFTAKSVMLLGTETVTFNGTLTTNSTNLCESFMVCDTAVAIFNPGSVLNDAGSLIVGNLDHGTLTALGNGSSHATLGSLDTAIGRLAGGVGTVTIDGAHWTNAANMVIGEHGQGALTVTENGVVAVGTGLTIGADQGSNGQVTVTNGGTLTVNATLDVGSGPGNPDAEGAGTLTIGAEGVVVVGSELNVYGSETMSMAGGTLKFGAYANGLRVFAGGTLSGFGTISTPACGMIAGSGTIVATGGTLHLDGSVQGPGGVLDIAGGATLDIQASAIGHVTIDFTGANGVLDLAQGVADIGLITDFAAGDTIVTSGVNGLAYNAADRFLTLTENGATVDRLQFTGAYASNDFTLTHSGASAAITVSLH